MASNPSGPRNREMAKAHVEVQHLTKSCNEALILAILADGKKHGYQLALELEERSDGFFRFNHGTLYPILHKLEKDGLIRGAWSDEGQRGKRKSYSLTAKGRRYSTDQAKSWGRFIKQFSKIVGGTKP
jgi:DNA-binding PadR family transcriptional regulator